VCRWAGFLFSLPDIFSVACMGFRYFGSINSCWCIPSSFARVGFYVAFSVVVSQRGGWVVGLCRSFCFFLGVVIAFAAYPSDVHILTTSFYRLLGFHRNFVLLVYLVGGYLLFGSRQANKLFSTWCLVLERAAFQLN
jgi:hypothetical protein